MFVKTRLRFGLKTFFVACIVFGTGFAFWGTVVARYQNEQVLIKEISQDSAVSSIVRHTEPFNHMILT